MNKTGEAAAISGATGAAPTPGVSEFFLTLQPQAGETAEQLFGRLARELEAREAEPVHVLAFGDVRHAPAAASQ